MTLSMIRRWLRRIFIDETALVHRSESCEDVSAGEASSGDPTDERTRASLETFARSYYQNPYGWIGGIHSESDEIRAVGRAAKRRSDLEERLGGEDRSRK